MTSSTIKILQDNIKKYRKEKGLTQLKLSLLTGISKDYIAAIETGRRVPGMKRFLIIAETLKIDPNKFFISE